MNARRIGLRLFEIETALAASEIDPTSAGLRHFRRTRLLGQALRLAQLIRGMDVIDMDRASAIAAAQLRIDPLVFDSVLESLQDADLIRIQGDKIYENVRQIDFAENYERVGDLWIAKKPDGREEMAVGALDELVEQPKTVDEIDAFSGANPRDLDMVMQITNNAHLVEPVDIGTGKPVLFAPMLWDVDPARFGAVLRQLKTASIGQVVQAIHAQPAGAELDRMQFDDTQQKLANRAVTVGLLPTIPVNSTNGERSFTFTPYSGMLIKDVTEREILGRARAIVACVRYGQRYADWKIRSPVALLRALRNRKSLDPHPELKHQYAQLVKRGVGRIERHGGMFRFHLIDSPENLRALDLAIELITHGQVMQHKVAPDASQGGALLQPGHIGDEFNGIRIAHRHQRATDNEIEELVEIIRS